MAGQVTIRKCALPLQVYRDHDHACAERLYGIGELQAVIGVQLVAQSLAQLDLGSKDEVGVEKLEAHAYFIAIVGSAHFQEFIGAVRAGIGSKVVVEFATQQGVKPEVVDTVALELELQRQVHIDGFYAAVGAAVGRVAVVELEIFLGKRQGGYETEIHKAAELQVAHQPQVEAWLPVRLYALEGVCIRKCLGVRYLVHRVIEPEGDAEIIWLVIVVGHIKQWALRHSRAGKQQ